MTETPEVTTNSQIARRLDELANLLEAQRANPFRVNAYRRGAMVISGLPEPVSEMYEREGVEGLEQLSHIGHTLAIAVRTLVETGRLPLLEHLRGEIDPVLLLESVPGIGRIQAERLHHGLGIDTLEDLEAAAHDGRLASIAGFGSKKVAGIIDSLASRLGRVRRSRNCWTLTGSTAKESGRAPFQRSRPGDSIRREKLGCRFCTPSAAIGITPRCSPTPPGRIDWEPLSTG